MDDWSELYPDANDVLGISVGGDEFPRMVGKPNYTPPTAEQRARAEKITADYIANAGWDKPAVKP